MEPKAGTLTGLQQVPSGVWDFMYTCACPGKSVMAIEDESIRQGETRQHLDGRCKGHAEVGILPVSLMNRKSLFKSGAVGQV